MVKSGPPESGRSDSSIVLGASYFEIVLSSRKFMTLAGAVVVLAAAAGLIAATQRPADSFGALIWSVVASTFVSIFVIQVILARSLLIRPFAERVLQANADSARVHSVVAAEDFRRLLRQHSQLRSAIEPFLVVTSDKVEVWVLRRKTLNRVFSVTPAEVESVERSVAWMVFIYGRNLDAVTVTSRSARGCDSWSFAPTQSGNWSHNVTVTDLHAELREWRERGWDGR